MTKKAYPKHNFKKIKLLVLDFDGVMTDNKVYIDESGREFVCCSRSDGLGIELLKKKDIKVIVISREKNRVVKTRCEKLKIPYIQGVNDKVSILQQVIKKHKISVSSVCYLGNDITDIGCVKSVGLGCAVLDSHPSLLKVAKFTTRKRGGNGAVREICELILGKPAVI